MPHDKNGNILVIGDTVRGVPYNTNGREVVGQVVGITPDMETCNVEVAFMEKVRLPAFFLTAEKYYELKHKED